MKHTIISFFRCSGFLFLILFSITTLLAQKDVLIIDKEETDGFNYKLSSYLLVLPDCDSKFDLDKVLKESNQKLFVKNNNQWLNSDCKTYWFKLEVKSNLSYDKELLAYLQGSFVTLYEPSDSLQYSTKQTGLLLPFSKRELGNTFGHFPYTTILIRKGGPFVYYWRVDTNDFPVVSPHTNLEPSLVSYKYALSKQRSYLFAFIFTCSILIGLSLYHITIYFITRETLYLYFSLFSFFSGLNAAYFKGYLLELFFSEFPRQHYQYAFLLAAVGFHVGMQIFVKKYLSIKK